MAVCAQNDPQYRMEIGAGVGVMTYEGDFNGNVLGDMQPAGFLVGRYNFDPYKDLKLSTTLALFSPYQGKGFSLKDLYEADHGAGSWETRDKNAYYFDYSNNNRYFGHFDVDWDCALSYQFLKCLQVTLQTSLKYYNGTLIADKEGNLSERCQFKGVIGLGVGYSF